MTSPALRQRPVTRVLLADDSDGLRLLVRSWLSAVDDVEVVAEASNGAEAVALTDAHRPDVVVLDVAMPVMDGLEALTELRRRYPTLPVVMLSGFAERDVASQAAARGAYAFVEKRGDLDPLVDVVRRAAAEAPHVPAQRPPVEHAAIDAAPARAAAVAAQPRPRARDRVRRLAPTALAAVFFVAVVAWRFTSDDVHAPIAFLLTVPILVISVRHGLAAGLASAAAAAVAYTAWAATTPAVHPGRVDHIARYVVFASAAVVAGTAFDRVRRAAAQQQLVNQAVATSNRRLAVANEQLSRVNRELEATNDDLRQFGYAVGHDLVEPLRTMSSFAGLLEHRCAGALDDAGRQYVRFIADGATRMQALVTDLRAYTQTGQAQLSRGPVELDDVLADVLAGLRRTLDERGAVVRSTPLPRVHGDQSMLGLVLQNLIANAVKFNTEPTPVVEVDAEQQGSRWAVRVRDNGIGIGIEPAAAEQVFGLFSRLHSAEEYPGTGLGLAIAKRIVERHDGAIAIAPRPGGGTVVTVELPAAGRGAR